MLHQKCEELNQRLKKFFSADNMTSEQKAEIVRILITFSQISKAVCKDNETYAAFLNGVFNEIALMGKMAGYQRRKDDPVFGIVAFKETRRDTAAA